ncbi:MAG TPA: response regulator [Chloroflexota bacterium]|nr:response regulator [Chloroflexota bacterium]
MNERADQPILIVEDDEATRHLLCMTLADEGFSTVAAGSGSVAFSLMAERQPQLILLDLHMPSMDGGAFLEELRRHEEWRAIPVLVVSAAPRIEDSLRGQGARGVLAKPFDLADLLNRVRELLPAG